MDKICLKLIQKTRNFLSNPFFQPPRGLGLEPSLAGGFSECQFPNVSRVNDLEDKKSEGFLWAVPKKRRSIEVRWCRNMGAKEWVWKMLEPKTNLRICETCGNHYEAKHLCRHCYEKVKKESELIRKHIEDQIANQAEDKSVVVLYGNEKEKVDTNALENQMIVEVPKERPAWFSKNLLQKSTIGPDPDTKTIVPKSTLA